MSIFKKPAKIMKSAAHLKTKVLEGDCRKKDTESLIGEYFDIKYYSEKNRDVTEAGINPVFHYIKFGEKEGRWPSPSFDPVFYAKRYCASLGGYGALEHYAIFGKNSGNATMDEGFDYHWYKLVYLNEGATDIDCHDHFKKQNRDNLLIKKGDPDLIKIRDEFDLRHYLLLNPDVRKLNPWHHYVSSGKKEGRNISPWIRSNFGNILHQVITVGQQSKMLHGIDFALDRLDISALYKLTSSGGQTLDPFNNALKNAVKDVDSKIAALVLVGSMGIGGAERYAANVFRSLVKIYGINNVILLATDGPIEQGRMWLPSGSKIMAISDYLPGANRETRARFIRRFISIIQPKSTYCVNSRALWDSAINPKNALDKYSRFYASLFCYDYNLQGVPVGYAASEFRQSFDFFKSYLIDNQSFVKQLKDDFSIPCSHAHKLQVVRSPVTIKTTKCKGQPDRVLWCGRLARQKIPEIVREIAQHCLEIRFDMYVVQGNVDIEKLDLPPNVRVLPSYDPEKGAPFENYGAFLYTSIWDGIPTILLDAASAGIPIVSTMSGGIGELIDEKTGWQIDDPYDSKEYARALKVILSAPEEVSRKTEGMHERLKALFSWQQFDAEISKIEQTE